MTLINRGMPYFDAVDQVIYDWERYRDATDTVVQAARLVDLSNSISDLKSWLESYDYETGTVDWERDD